MNLKKVAICIVTALALCTIRPEALCAAGQTVQAKEYVSVSRGITLDRNEFYLLARLIHAEARGEPLEGQVAVGAVVFNRLQDPRFPKTITGVIYEKDQFTPIMDGSINTPPGEQAIFAAQLALNGLDPTGGSLFFYNPDQAESTWLDELPVMIKIGRHIFC